MTTTQPSGDTGGGLADPSRPGTPRDRYGWPVYAWGLWDWGSAAFNAVITTFVFSVYITSDDVSGPARPSKLGWALAGAGVADRADRPDQRPARRTARDGVPSGSALNTGLVVLATARAVLRQAVPGLPVARACCCSPRATCSSSSPR